MKRIVSYLKEMEEWIILPITGVYLIAVILIQSVFWNFINLSVFLSIVFYILYRFRNS